MKKTLLSFYTIIIMLIMIFSTQNSLYAFDEVITNLDDIELDLPSEAILQEIPTLPLGAYEKGVSIREGIIEEVISVPEEGWNMTHHFEVTASEVFDDNIYGEEDNTIEDFVTTVSPSLRMDFIRKKIFITTNYKFGARHYLDLSDEHFDHAFGAMAAYRPEPRLLFTLSELYTKKNSLNEIENTDLVSTGRTVETYDTNVIKFRGEYDVIRGNNILWVNYVNSISGLHYHTWNNDLSAKKHTLGLGWTHSYTRRTSVSPGLQFDRYTNRVTKESDYNASGVTLGFKHALTNVLDTDGKLGWEYRDYTKREKAKVP